MEMSTLLFIVGELVLLTPTILVILGLLDLIGVIELQNS